MAVLVRLVWMRACMPYLLQRPVPEGLYMLALVLHSVLLPRGDLIFLILVFHNGDIASKPLITSL
jgi:hypothetical protein